MWPLPVKEEKKSVVRLEWRNRPALLRRIGRLIKKKKKKKKRERVHCPETV